MLGVGAVVLGMGAVVLLDSTKMLVVGNMLVLLYEEGGVEPQGGEENHFYALGAPHSPIYGSRMLIFDHEKTPPL